MKLLIRTSLLIWLGISFFNAGYAQIVSYLDYIPTIFEGSSVLDNVHSMSLENNLLGDSPDRDVSIYLPPGYDNAWPNRYPVIYFLHGYTSDHLTFFGGYRPVLDFKVILDELIASGAVSPVIVVSPNSNNTYKGSFYTNSTVAGNWEDFIVRDVLEYMDRNYSTIASGDNRGIAGHSMGGYGTIKLAMNNPSLFSSAYMLSGYGLVLEDFVMDIQYSRLLEAVTAESFESVHWLAQSYFAQACAFAQDTAARFYGQFPVNENGERIDSIWQKWLLHDPYTMLSTHKDSLLKLNALQFDCGRQDDYFFFEPTVKYSQALDQQGIPHVFEAYEGDHVNRLHQRIKTRLLPFFDVNLDNAIPGIIRKSDYHLERTDVLLVETDVDAMLYLIPSTVGSGLDSILRHQVGSLSAPANEDYEIQLRDLEYGKYQVYAISSDTMVSNIPAELCVVPDASPPKLSFLSSSVVQKDSIRVSMNRSGKICLIVQNLFLPDTLRTASDIMNSDYLKQSIDVLPGSEVSFSTDDLALRSYYIYGFDQYGIVSGPVSVEVTPVGIPSNGPLEINLYPNPTNHTLTLEAEQHGYHAIHITSLNGQIVYKSEMEGPTHQFDLSSFESGVYFITIRSKDFVTTRKIIKL